MYSFSSASQICDPLPRTINGGSPPTDRNARTGEFTPPGIMLSARCCSRRDCSVFREVVLGIESSRHREDNLKAEKSARRRTRRAARSVAPFATQYSRAQLAYLSDANNRLLYQRAVNRIHQIFIVLQSLCNISAVP